MKPNNFEGIPGKVYSIDDFPHGYAGNTRGILPELKFSYAILSNLPLIQFTNVGKSYNTSFHQIEYGIRRLVGYKWDNNIRTIHYYNGGRVSLPFHCQYDYLDNRFHIAVYKLDGSATIYSKSVEVTGNWYEFILPSYVVDEIGSELKKYSDYILSLA